MIRTLSDSHQVKLSGATMSIFVEKKLPARLANAAPMAKARSFIRTVFTPVASAATSSSRVYVQPLPIRESASRTATNAVITATPMIRK